ncbi:MAG TPA: cob(I)yrinic acid a,c-diamide adenosyltransferase [Cyclobacteriaceae bacterium]|nr:cob(I)yrinic acid a,c-diamide adenosyltransferase [Cyclobacteriaceae bacterium]
MKIYTKTGDKGTTALLGGIRVSKAHLRIDAYGTVDELNANIGLLNDQEINQKRAAKLKAVQEALFVIGADLATAPEKQSVKKPVLGPGEVEMLENEIDAMEDQLEPLTRFILPGGHQVVSYCHLARTVCRRAERCVIALHEQEPVDEIILLYLNRLSDYLFVLGRFVAKELKVEEITWDTRN